MNDYLSVIERTRQKAASIMAAVVGHIDGKSEAAVRDEMKVAVEADVETFEAGWYDPPLGGFIALFGKEPFDRLKYETARDPQFFARDDIYFDSETVAMLHLCPVDRKIGLLGDFGGTIYKGSDVQIQKHIKEVRDLMINIGERSEVGMTFSELFAYAGKMFADADKTIAWMSTVHDFMQINLGHTVPGTLGEQVPTGSFAEAKEYIQTHRVFINARQEFKIPATCAFTVEARLTNMAMTLPNVYFHVIVCFSEGEKTILTNFDDVFKAAGMDYML